MVNFSASSQEKAKEAEQFVCPEGTQGNGNFADPATCRRFYQVRFFDNPNNGQQRPLLLLFEGYFNNKITWEIASDSKTKHYNDIGLKKVIFC